MKTFANIFLGLFIFEAIVAAPTIDTLTYDSETYDVALEDLDNLYDYNENLPVDQAEIEIGTVLPSVTREIPPPPSLPEEAEEEASTPKLIDGSSPQGSVHSREQWVAWAGSRHQRSKQVLGAAVRKGQQFLLPIVGRGSFFLLPAMAEVIFPTAWGGKNCRTALLMVKGKHVDNLKRIDLTSNFISEIDEDAFRELPQLQELVLRDNKIRQLPELPPTLTFIDVSNNRLGRKGIKEEAFKDMVDLHHLYITDNNLDHIPLPLPESLQALHLQNNNIQEMHEDTFCKMKDVAYARRALEDIRLDGNPINLSKTPSAYMCLPRLPIGSLI
ncbi:Epiphycan [Chelonia mydas]|uniref:Epiphycan n=1 Tax=Chelonia mydas TaxID=8469 RepID=M7C702_CHEMY|nr:Epiphycan [Chelonia mydas]